jgi:hypothetical protein
MEGGDREIESMSTSNEASKQSSDLSNAPVGLWPYIILFSNYSGREKEEQKNILFFI